ncbi:hypothetical protein MRX96_049326 [Rhipicephalus microplus]
MQVPREAPGNRNSAEQLSHNDHTENFTKFLQQMCLNQAPISAEDKAQINTTKKEKKVVITRRRTSAKENFKSALRHVHISFCDTYSAQRMTQFSKHKAVNRFVPKACAINAKTMQHAT